MPLGALFWHPQTRARALVLPKQRSPSSPVRFEASPRKALTWSKIQISESLQTHPYLVNRIQEIIYFSNSGKYESLISNTGGFQSMASQDDHYEDHDNFDSLPANDESFCIECGENMSSQDLICLNCGAIKNEDL